MAVREALLALLTTGPAYGFALHGGLAARTGGRREINVGQSYATLERATKAGFIESAGSTPDGLPLHRLTSSGRDLASAWLGGVDASGADAWDETVDRVLIAASLPGTSLDPVLNAERAKWLDRQAAAREAAAMPDAPSHDADAPDADAPDADAPAARLVALAAGAELVRATAALAWLDEVGAAEASDALLAFAPSTERPRRGRRRSTTGPQPSTEPQAPGEAQPSTEA